MEEVFRNNCSNIHADMSKGVHACLFYHTKEDLAEIVVPYLKAGLENREFCIWILPENISLEEARQSLRKPIPELNTYLEKAQIEIFSYASWSIKSKNFNSKRTLNFWAEKLTHALNKGYSGLRLAQDLTWLKEKGGKDIFIDYEKALNSLILSNQVVALCTYSLDKWNSSEILEIMREHQFFLSKKEKIWERIEVSKSYFREYNEQHAWLQAIIESLPVGLWIADSAGKMVFINNTARKIWGGMAPLAEDIMEYATYKAWWPETGERITPEDMPLARAIRGEVCTERVIDFERFDGTHGIQLVSSAPIKMFDGTIIGGIAIVKDITEQKHAEEALRQSDFQYQTLFNSIDEGFCIIEMLFDENGKPIDYRFVETNPAFEKQTGLLNARGKRMREFASEHEEHWFEIYGEIALTGKTAHFQNRAEQLHRWYDVYAFRYGEPEKRQVAILFNDISESKQVEEELKESREKYRILFNSVSEGFGYYRAIYDKNSTICDLLVLEINPAGANISGIGREVQIGKTWREVWPEVEDYWFEAYRKVDQTGKSIQFENFSSITGKWYSVQIDCVQKGEFAVTFRDITERKQEEHRINRYNSVLEGISQILTNAVQTSTEEDLGNVCLDVALDITESQLGFIGVVEADGLLHDIAISNMGWEQCFMYDKTGHLQPLGNFNLEGLYGSAIIKGKSFFTNNPSSHPDSTGLPEGHPPINSFLGVPFIFNGKTKGIFAVANREGGYSREQQEDLEAIAPAVIQALERKKVEQEREEAQKALNTAYQELEEKVKIRTSELETAYNSLKENERRLSEAQKIAHIGYWDWDILNDKLHWSEETYCIFGLYPQKFGASYEAFINSVHPEDRAYVDNAVKKALTGTPYAIDFRVVLEEGEERIIHSQGKVLFNNKNMPIIMRGTVQDITEKKRAEQAFLNSVAARKKEIHHRIKNNLQVISSLLDLQAEKFGNKKCLENSEILEAFKESQDRVVSMALIHEELHEGGGNEYLNFSQYLEKLIAHLFMTYTLENVEISLNLDLQEDIFFDMDTAAPLGIIVNELVSNSLKYAFSDREKGEIRIRLYRDENQGSEDEIPESKDKEPAGSVEKRYTLIVSDNGIGIPETISLEGSDTLGVQLVTILVDQLDGEIELNREAGTEFIIKVQVAEKA